MTQRAQLPVWAPFALLAALAPTLASAQEVDRDPIPLSQYQEVTQSLGWAQVKVEYRRPVARGRELFGALVPWGEEWTPSADSAAVLTFTEPVLVGGESVPAGSYSLWLVPREEGPWTVVLSDDARVFHAPYPPGEDRLRIELHPEPSAHMEALAIHFPRVMGRDAILAVHWGETLVPIPLRLP